MSTVLHELVTEALATAKANGMSQKELADISSLGEVALSRLKKADDAKFSTLTELGRSVGKRLVWVDDHSDVPSLVRKGQLF